MKTIKKIGATAGATIALALALNSNAQAQMSGSVEGMISTEQSHSYIRGNAFYSLPGTIKGYTFLEAYPDNAASEVGSGFFGKTTLSKEIIPRVDALAQATHITGADDRLSLGLRYTVPTPEGTTFKMHYFPRYFDTKFNRLQDRSVAGFFAAADLPLDFKLSSFGEINLAASKGAEWTYGEVSIMRALPFAEEVSAGWTAGLRNVKKGDLNPRFENRFELMYKFK